MFTLWILAEGAVDIPVIGPWVALGQLGANAVALGLFAWLIAVQLPREKKERQDLDAAAEAKRLAATEKAAELCARQQREMFEASRADMAAERAAHKETQATLMINREAIVKLTSTVAELIASIDKRELRTRRKEEE